MRCLPALTLALVVLAAAPAQAAPPENVTAPVVTGDPWVGEVATVSNGTWSGAPDAFRQEWWHCLPSGAGGCTPSRVGLGTTYAIAPADVGGDVYAAVCAHNAEGWTAKCTVSRNALGPITAARPPAVNTARPRVSGTAYVGLTLTTTTGAWDAVPDAAEVQWMRFTAGATFTSSPILGATLTTYTTGPLDLGRYLGTRVRVRVGTAWSAWTSSENLAGPVREFAAPPPDDPPPDDEEDPGEDEEPDPSAPAITSLVLRPATFRAARSGPSLAAIPRGTTVVADFMRNAYGTLEVGAQAARSGRRVGRRCLAATRSRRRRPSCTRWVTVRGTATRRLDLVAETTFRFTGRLGGRALAPGRYRLVAHTVAGRLEGPPARAAFRIVR